MIKLLSKENHGDKSWVKFTSYAFANQNSSVPLVGAEVLKAGAAFPMAFVLHQDQYLLKAILSPVPEGNCFVAPDGRWLGSYVPAFFRSHPFKLGQVAGKEELYLCVDEDSGLVQDGSDSGQPFLNDNGELSPAVEAIKTFLQNVAENERETQKAVQCIADAGLMTSWQFKVTIAEKEKVVTGYYCIDETRLNQLSDQAVLSLRQSGAFSIIYAQLVSMSHIPKLTQLAGIKAQLARVQLPVPAPTPEPFGFGADDMIGF